MVGWQGSWYRPISWALCCPARSQKPRGHMEYNTRQILILIPTFNCRSSCLTPKLLCPPSHRGTAEEVPAVPSASEAGRSALCLDRGYQLPSFTCPRLLTSQKGLRLPPLHSPAVGSAVQGWQSQLQLIPCSG